MRAIAIQLIASSVALALMAGGAGVHWWKVRGMEAETVTPQWLSLQEERPAGGWAMLASTGSRKDDPPQEVTPSRAEMNATLTALEEVVDVLRDLKKENAELRDQNQDMRSQVKEVNLYLNELQFRVDTHSESFRPLKADSGNQRVLKSDHSLLPPKNW